MYKKTIIPLAVCFALIASILLWKFSDRLFIFNTGDVADEGAGVYIYWSGFSATDAKQNMDMPNIFAWDPETNTNKSTGACGYILQGTNNNGTVYAVCFNADQPDTFALYRLQGGKAHFERNMVIPEHGVQFIAHQNDHLYYTYYDSYNKTYGIQRKGLYGTMDSYNVKPYFSSNNFVIYDMSYLSFTEQGSFMPEPFPANALGCFSANGIFSFVTSSSKLYTIAPNEKAQLIEKDCAAQGWYSENELIYAKTSGQLWLYNILTGQHTPVYDQNNNPISIQPSLSGMFVADNNTVAYIAPRSTTTFDGIQRLALLDLTTGETTFSSFDIFTRPDGVATLQFGK